MRKRDLTWNGIQTRHRDRQLRDCTESKPTHWIRQSESIRIDFFPALVTIGLHRRNVDNFKTLLS